MCNCRGNEKEGFRIVTRTAERDRKNCDILRPGQPMVVGDIVNRMLWAIRKTFLRAYAEASEKMPEPRKTAIEGKTTE